MMVETTWMAIIVAGFIAVGLTAIIGVLKHDREKLDRVGSDGE